MRPSKALGPVAVTALAAVLACAPFAQADTPDLDASLSGDGGKVIKLVAVPTQSAYLPLGVLGDSAPLGDEYVFADELFHDGTSVGSDGVVCTVFSTTPDLAQCEATLHLPKGDITLQGIAPLTEDFPSKFTFAITGGTGSYHNARGYLDGVNVSQTQTDLTLHLSK
ncbi:hypothetical protein ACFWDI_09955 [Streptomyces sp. NPDC060064]|uniref:allene oxide cyclase barrel-like domain-containing protein n=1 Tax=Streptomyces sp. NPDC060064 TaxID=3347049 RepID=UPI0036968BF8